MASGVALGQSLAYNSALTELKLAHNSLADAGVQAVGHFGGTVGTQDKRCQIGMSRLYYR